MDTCTRLACFKAYDIRGRVPETLSAPLAFALGMALADVLGVQGAVVGRDARLSGPALRDGLVAGLQRRGVVVADMGMCGTEEIYHATARHDWDVGIMITGSHNPADENGFKLVRRGAIPVSADSGLNTLHERVAELLRPSPPPLPAPAAVQTVSYRGEYARWLANHADLGAGTPPLKILADAGNGCAGLVLRELAPLLPCTLVLRHAEPDGTFPHGVPNPLLPERRAATAQAVRETGADMGLAWDGDFDRCFFYDAAGQFIEGYYLVGLLAQELLRTHPGGTIIHDPRLYWNTRDVVGAAGGVPVMGKTGHAFIKERMRTEDAIYGGEMSAHHYFRDFAYCDSGMLPWLLVASLVRRTGRPLAALVTERMAAYPCSGEINRRVNDAPALMHRVREVYGPMATHEDSIDGINLEFPNWRFNLRMSNTEPLIRLNVESRGDAALMREKTAELLRFLEQHGDARPTR